MRPNKKCVQQAFLKIPRLLTQPTHFTHSCAMAVNRLAFALALLPTPGRLLIVYAD